MTDFKVRQIDHVELFVPDQYAAAAWFERVFGLTIVKDFEHWAASGPLMLTTAEGDTKLALFAGEAPTAPPRVGFHRVAFRVDGRGFAQFLARLDELELESEHGHPVGPDDWVDHGQAWSVYFVDPWGHRFEITTYDIERLADGSE